MSSPFKGLPPLKLLVTFRAVIDHGSFASAARALNLTTSAVSHQMRSLEHYLNRPLFLRKNRTVAPTPEALSYNAALLESFAQIASATRRVASRGNRGRLTLHSSPSFATLWLMPRIGEFIHDHPEIDVTLSSGNEPMRLGDDGFMIDIQHARPIPEACEGIVLAEELMVPMASPAFVKQHKLKNFIDIERVPIIFSIRCQVQWNQWIDHYAAHIPLPSSGMIFDRSYLSIAAAMDGLGLVLDSTLLAAHALKTGKLVMPFGPLGVKVISHRLIYRRADRHDPFMMSFIEWITKKIATDSDPLRVAKNPKTAIKLQK
jgi:LysR family glycine cleavage system transcriptional activator